LGDHAGRTRDIEALGEFARTALARTITHRLQSPDGKLRLMVLEPALEAYLRERVEQTPNGATLSLDIDASRALLNAIAQHAQQMTARGYLPVLACAGNLRLPIRKLLGAELPQVHIIAYHEIAPNTNIEIVEQISRAEVIGTAAAA
ncbi:MAG: FHIPEP family type III secretion protein, partial [Candidatus Caldarchaeum sp.]